MKGIVFNALEDFIDENFGEGTFDFLASEALPGNIEPFVGPGTYPDADLLAIVTKAIEVKNLSLEDVLKQFGYFLFFKLAEKFPVFLEKYDHPKDFLQTVHDVIHVEVNKLFPEAITPNFTYKSNNENHLQMRYESPRNLFPLAQGLIQGSCDHYNVPVVLTLSEQNTEKNYCIFDLIFS